MDNVDRFFGFVAVCTLISGVVVGIAPVVFFLIVLLIIYIISKFSLYNRWASADPVDYNSPKEGGFGYERKLIILLAYIMHADGKITKKEIYLVRRYFTKDFEPAMVKKFMGYLNKAIRDKISMHYAAKELADEHNTETHIQIMYVLIGLATVDGYLHPEEVKALDKIADYFGLPNKTLESLFAMFKFSRTDPNQEQYKKQYRPKRYLSGAFTILEITESATDDEVKKAYRRLAKIHHPDKFVHKGPEFQKQAKEKFQKILEAYEYIKAKRGIN